ncbi:MAG: EAL domain-containing protein [Oscillospiraceae bacterium]|nr:EAL domain-containing protein [Oscillospiraceae bacterium]
MNKHTVLIVEDEPVNRKILKKILQDQYETIEVENGAAAWDILVRQKDGISAVLLDIVMPVMNGYELLTKMQEAHMEDIPVIVTTGATDEDAEHKALDVGAWDFVTKPYNAKALFSRLRNAIARSELSAYEKSRYILEHDTLTGLYNRGKTFAETRRLLDSHPDKTFVFMRVDIDHFALFNTSFGEREGDKLIKFLAQCIADEAKGRPYCVYGRINADVFGVCDLYGGTPDELLRRIERIQERLTRYRQDYRLEVSVGAFAIDAPGRNVEDCYFRASVAAQNCKDKVDTHLSFYDKSSGERLAAEVAIANEMQTALEQRQFVVYLQPKFDVATEQACGAEALVRWKHPVKGMIPPGEFIPIFEKNGFIPKLDYYVWEETCRMLSQWQSEGRTMYPVSVNISRISLYNPQLAEMMTELVKTYQIPPSLLHLEVTESAYMTNPELMEGTIRALHEAGFTIMMDDFGSGYSSLNTLKRIRVDVLKVDMKFLPVKDEAGRGEIILSSVIRMANWLGMSVVVEGVETRRQRDFLAGAGCDFIQGFYYSKPIPGRNMRRPI